MLDLKAQMLKIKKKVKFCVMDQISNKTVSSKKRKEALSFDFSKKNMISFTYLTYLHCQKLT